jgi:hypothetical protein
MGILDTKNGIDDEKWYYAIIKKKNQGNAYQDGCVPKATIILDLIYEVA